MLRVHFMQQWVGLSDPAMEEAVHDMALFSEFAQLVAGNTPLPDACTILRIRHILEAQQFTIQMLASVNASVIDRGLMVEVGTATTAPVIRAR